MVSGTIDEEVAVACKRLGARDYIMKHNLFHRCPPMAR
jgi:hypothetical protein